MATTSYRKGMSAVPIKTMLIDPDPRAARVAHESAVTHPRDLSDRIERKRIEEVTGQQPHARAVAAGYRGESGRALARYALGIREVVRPPRPRTRSARRRGFRV
jgi:uncharacterized membrane protein